MLWLGLFSDTEEQSRILGKCVDVCCGVCWCVLVCVGGMCVCKDIKLDFVGIQALRVFYCSWWLGCYVLFAAFVLEGGGDKRYIEGGKYSLGNHNSTPTLKSTSL